MKRCWKRFNETEPKYGYKQALFPIVQGCVYKDLRQESARFMSDFGAEGYAIGGLAVGEPAEMMYEMIEVVNDILPTDRPRYLMGVGTPINILEAIERGVDMFDCVMPTRNGRNACLFTAEGIINMRNAKWLIALSLSTPWRIVLPMCNTPKPTCTTCSKPRNCWPCKLPLSTIWHSTCGWCARHANKLWQTTSDHGNATWLKSLDVNCKTPC